MSHLVVVGDTFLDRDLDGHCNRLSPDAPVPVVEDVHERVRPGGAALTACIAARAGHAVTLVTALGDDPAGRRARRLLTDAGIDLRLAHVTDTEQKVRVRADGVPMVRVDLGGATTRPAVPTGTGDALASTDAIVVSDYGRGLAAAVLAAGHLPDAHAPVVWDPHPRGPVPPGGTTVTTPNASEAGLPPEAALHHAIDAAQRLRAVWGVGAVAVTRGAEGAVLAAAGDTMPFVAPAPEPAAGDPCGAGDAFAAALGARLAVTTPLPDAVVAAVAAATRFVASGTLATLGIGGRAPDDAGAAIADDTAPVVVATSGHFDHLHDGHVEMLRCARRLGDRLVVLVNSDRSRSALGRPGRSESARVAALRAVAAVDEVVLFDDPTPLATLRTLRPAVFVKGGDYSRTTAEADALRAWGGRAVTVPWFPVSARIGSGSRVRTR